TRPELVDMITLFADIHLGKSCVTCNDTPGFIGINEKGYADYPELVAPFIDDTIMEVSAAGEVKKELSIVQAFLNSQYTPFLALMNTNLLGDVMHTNTVQYIDAATAEKFAFAEEGHLLISMREMNVIAILDPQAERIVWAQAGLWQAQHEPVMLNNGRIMIFDNQGNRGDGGATRIIEFDPAKGSIDWNFAGTRKEPLHSPVYGSIQRLASGNTMIVESTNGRAMEVTAEGKVVWD
ncbi:MAG: arylsulfotransferase family protein, partial [Pseudomonadota bacterium]